MTARDPRTERRLEESESREPKAEGQKPAVRLPADDVDVTFGGKGIVRLHEHLDP